MKASLSVTPDVGRYETLEISVQMHFTGSSCYHNRRVVAASSLLEMIQASMNHGFFSPWAISIKLRETLIRVLAIHTRGHQLLICMRSF